MKLLNKLKLNNLSLVFWGYALVILAIVLPWFFDSGYLFFTDLVWGKNILFGWQSNWFLYNLLIVKPLSYILPLFLVEKIILTFIIVTLLWSGYVAVRELLYTLGRTHNNGAIFVMSLFVLFSPFVYDRLLYGQINIVLGLSFMILTVANLLSYLNNDQIKYIVYAGIFSGLTILFSVHFVFFLLLIYCLLFILLLLKTPEVNSLKFIKAILISAVLIILINVNWLAAVALNKSAINSLVNQNITNQDLIAFQTSGKTSWNALGNVLMMRGFWGNDQHRYIDLASRPGWCISFFLLLPIIIIGVIVSLKRKAKDDKDYLKPFSIGVLILFVIATILAVGIRMPGLGGAVQWLYDHVPYYRGLRESQKWVSVIVLVYLYFLTIGANWLSQKKLIKENSYVAGIILTIVIIMQAPLLIWGFGNQTKPTNYPADWHYVDQYLKAQDNCQQKNLFLPWHLYMSFNWLGQIVANPAPVFFTCPIISGTNMEFGSIYDNSTDEQGQSVGLWLQTNGADKEILSKLNVGHVIITKEVDWRAYDWVGQLKYVKLIKSTPMFMIYEIKP